MLTVAGFVGSLLQTPLAANVTGLPEPPPVALIVTDATSKLVLAGCVNEIAWTDFSTLMVTSLAAPV